MATELSKDIEESKIHASIQSDDHNFDRVQSRNDRSELFDLTDVIIMPESSSRSPNLNVQEAYVTKRIQPIINNENNIAPSISEKPLNGIFGKFTDTIQSIIHWRRLKLTNSQVTPESGTHFLDATRTNPTSSRAAANRETCTSEAIAMNTFVTDKSKTNNYSIQTPQEPNNLDFTNFPVNLESEMNSDYVPYNTTQYSLNSAGNPILMTIENDRNEDSSDSTSSESLEGNSNVDGSDLQVNLIKKKEKNWKAYFMKAWFKTYHPDSQFIYCWLLLITLVLLYNAWIIPLRACFDAEIQAPFQNVWFGFDAVCDIIFLIDIVIKFRTQFMRRGLFVSNVAILTRYHIKEWTLILDILAIFPTDLFFIQIINAFLRLNRLVKIYRVYLFYRTVELKTKWPNVLRVANLLHTIVFIIHWSACVYYLICLNNGFGATLSSWAYPNPVIYPDYSTLTRQYSYSFYWALQEISLVGGRPLPEAEWQFVYAVYMNLLGIGIIAYTIGYVTMILLGTNTEKFEFERAMDTTRDYMRRRKLPRELRTRVEEFYDCVWRKSEFAHLDEDRMLRHLPISIKEEIAYHGNYSALKELPELAQCDPNILKSLVSKLKRRTYLPGQFVYKNGDAGTEMFIVGEGVLQIIRERDGKVRTVRDGDIFGEMNIFNLRKNYRRTSDVISVGYCELYVLTSNDINEVLSHYPRIRNIVLQQAKREKALYRRKMSQNFYKRHRKYLYTQSDSPSESGKASSSNVSSGVRRRVSGVTGLNTMTGATFGNMNESPDSGMPSSPDRQKTNPTEFSILSNVFSNGNEYAMPSDISSKLTAIYQKNFKSLQKSLDEVWLNEVVCIKREMENATAERDLKTREIAQLRQFVTNERATKFSAKRRNSTPTIAEEIEEDEGPQKPSGPIEKTHSSTEVPKQVSTKANNKKLQSNVKQRPNTKSNKRRTFLPSVSSSDQNGKIEEVT